MVTILKPETSKITTKTVLKLETSKITTKKSGPTKKIGPEKMEKITSWFEPLERRGIVDLGGVATGDGVQLVLKR